MVKPNFKNFLGDRVFDENAEDGDDSFSRFNTMTRQFAEYHIKRGDIARELREIETDEELLDFVERYFRIRIPYSNPVPGQQTLAEAFCDLYFERVSTALWWASRASGKSFMTGLLTVLDSLRYDRCETTILAGSEQQGRQVYSAAEQHVHVASLLNYIDMKKTYANVSNGSSFQVLTASPKSARGPHPQRLKLDEVDEIPEEVFVAAINQPMSKHGVRQQTLMTSTMHKVFGLMSQLIDDKESRGIKVYKWNYKAVTEQCLEPDCRHLIYSERFAGLPCPLLGDHRESLIHLPEDERFGIRPAREYVTFDGRDDNGEIISGYFDGSCQGDIRHSDGYVPVDDQRSAFVRVPLKTWETENECRRPSQEDMVYDPRFLQRQTISGIVWDYDLPEERNWGMVDWGFNNPTAFIVGQERVLPDYELTVRPLHRVLVREWYWEQRGLNWRIEQLVNLIINYRIREVYADGENADALFALREALANAKWTCLVQGVAFNRFKDTLIDDIRNDMENGHWFISAEGCPNTLRDMYRLHYRPNTEKVAKEHDHGPDAVVAGWRRFIDLSVGKSTGADLGSVSRVSKLMETNRGNMNAPGDAFKRRPTTTNINPNSPVAVISRTGRRRHRGQSPW